MCPSARSVFRGDAVVHSRAIAKSPHMPESSITCSQLSFSWPGETPLFEELSFTVAYARTGLVPPNGAGKSTLRKLIAGEHRPSAGLVTVEGSLGYLPQTL